MRKILIGLLFLPSICFADRLGALRSGTEVLLSTQGIKNQDSLQAGATFFVSSGTVYNLTASTLAVYNPDGLQATIISPNGYGDILRLWQLQFAGNYGAYLLYQQGNTVLWRAGTDMYNSTCSDGLSTCLTQPYIIKGITGSPAFSFDQNNHMTAGRVWTPSVNYTNLNGNVSIGNWVDVATAPTNGLMVQGNTILGSTNAWALSTTAQVQIYGAPTNTYSLIVSTSLQTRDFSISTMGVVQVNSKNICLADGTNCSASAGGVTVYAATATASFPFGLSASTIAVNGPGDGEVIPTIFGSTYTVVSSSGWTKGNFAIFTSTWGTIGNGGTSAGGGTPGGSAFQVQYSSANGTQFAGSPNMTNNGSTVTFSGIYTITETNVSSVTYSGVYFDYTGSTLTVSKVTITSNTIMTGATFYQNGLIQLGGAVSASLPLKTDASKYLVTSAIDLSGSEATGTMAAARMPALTGDITTSAGAVATTLTNSIPNIHNWAGAATFAASVTVNSSVLMGAAASAVTISSNAITPGATFYQNGVIGTNLSASLPVKTDASKFLTAAAVNLSGSEVTGTMAAARMPALTGDITTSAGAVATTLTNGIANIHSWSGASTFTSSMTVRNDFLLQVGTMTLQSPPQIPAQTLTVINLIAPKAVGQLICCTDCTALTLCVSSGTGIGAWVSPTAKTTACR